MKTFGPLWQLALAAPVGLYGLANAAVLSAGGIGSWLSTRLTLAKPATIVGMAVLLVGSSPGTGLREECRGRHPGPGSAGRRRGWGQHGLYPLAARFPPLRGECPLLERLCALRAALWGDEPTRRRLSRRVDGGWGGTAGRYTAGHRGRGPGLHLKWYTFTTLCRLMP